MQRKRLWTGTGLFLALCLGQADGLADWRAGKMLWHENFDDLKDGATEDKGDTAWSMKGNDPNGRVSVQNKELMMEWTLDEVVWTSGEIDISKADSAKVTVDVRGEGSIDDDPGTEDHYRVFAKIDGGDEVLLGKLEGYLDQEENTISKGGLKGKKIVLVIRAMNSGDDEVWVTESVKVTAEE